MSVGRSARPDRRRAADHGQHRLHFRDYLHGQRRRGASTYTAGAIIDVNGWRVQINGAPATGDTLHRAQQCRRRRRQPQCVRARRCPESRRARRRHDVRVSAPSSGLSANVATCRRAPRRSTRDAEAIVHRQRRRRAGRGVGRQPRRGGRQHAALPAGLPGRGADHRGGRTRCSTRCSTRCGDKPCAFPPPACIAAASTPSSSTRSSSRRRRTRSPPARSSRPLPRIRSAPPAPRAWNANSRTTRNTGAIQTSSRAASATRNRRWRT